MLDVLTQPRREVARSGAQEMIEAFTAQGADEAFCDRVRSRRLQRRLGDVPERVEDDQPVPQQHPPRLVQPRRRPGVPADSHLSVNEYKPVGKALIRGGI
jgi:hypothetical protein